MIDIGGGSTEYVTGQAGSDPGFHVSTRMGSVRFTERHVHSDPPEREELAALAEDARGVVEAEVPAEVARRASSRASRVAGTATTLAAIDLELDPYDPEQVHGYRVSLAACERIVAKLAALTVAERRGVTGLHPDRAPTIVAGTVIMLESMRAFDLDEIEVSESDILRRRRARRGRPASDHGAVRRAWLIALVLLAGCADDPAAPPAEVTVPAERRLAAERPHRPEHHRRRSEGRGRAAARGRTRSGGGARRSAPARHGDRHRLRRRRGPRARVDQGDDHLPCRRRPHAHPAARALLPAASGGAHPLEPGRLAARRAAPHADPHPAGDRCGDARAIAVRGELWGEAINGSGLEAVTPHLRFRWAFP